jgi:chromate transporter
LSEPPIKVSKTELFLGFGKLGAVAFGGTGPISRHILVVERNWLSEADYAALLGLCQALPGANTCNLAVMLGDRYQGAGGAVAALGGLLVAPLLILVGVATLFARTAGQPDMRAALLGATAAAAGLVIGTSIRMIRALPFDAPLLSVAAATFVTAAFLRLPLALTIAALLPISLLLRRFWR